MCNTHPRPIAPEQSGKPSAKKCIAHEATWLNYPIEDLLSNWQRPAINPAAAFTLENATHPLFSRDQFGPQFHYNALLPALQLATLFITYPNLMDYWYAAFLSTPRDFKYTDREETYNAIFRKGSPISKAELKDIETCFRSLAKNVSFKRSNNGIGAWAKTACVNVEPTTRTPLGEQSHVRWQGQQSNIEIDDLLYDPVITAYTAAATKPSPQTCQDLALAYFEFAKAIVHELAHAAQNLRWGGPRDAAMPFEDQVVSEEGFDWEALIFGGLIQNSVTGPEGQTLALTSWPKSVEADLYAKMLLNVAILAPWDAIQLDSDVMWRISPAFIAAFFQKTFWKQHVATHGVQALHHPRLLGARLAPLVAPSKSCYCERCLWFEDSVMRNYMRGNGPKAKPGTYLAQAKQKAKSKVRVDSDAADLTGSTAVSERAIPASDRESGIQPTEHCPLDTVWRTWCRPTDLTDNRDPSTFGLPSGTKSTLDGSVVATPHFDTITAWEQQQRGRRVPRHTLQTNGDIARQAG